MTNQWKKIYQHPFVKIAILIVIAAVIIGRIGWSYRTTSSHQAAVQGAIQVEPLSVKPNDPPGKIQPGTQVKLSLKVENKGPSSSPQGFAFIRYAFPKPLDHEPSSVLFHTEKVAVPSLEAGKSTVISFQTPHQWPTIPDFIRYDWPMREYQAVLQIDDHDYIIGTQAITYSAYYYPGMRNELPAHLQIN